MATKHVVSVFSDGKFARSVWPPGLRASLESSSGGLSNSPPATPGGRWLSDE